MYQRYSPEPYRLPPILPSFPSPPPFPVPEHSYHPSRSHSQISNDPYYSRLAASRPADYDSYDGGPIRNHPRTPRGRSLPPLRYITSFDDPSPSRELPPLSLPYPPLHIQRPYTPPQITEARSNRLPNYPPTPAEGTRTMLERTCTLDEYLVKFSANPTPQKHGM